MRVRLIDGMNCTPMVFTEKPPSRKLTVPVLKTIFRNLPTPNPHASASHSPGLQDAFKAVKNSRALSWLLSSMQLLNTACGYRTDRAIGLYR